MKEIIELNCVGMKSPFPIIEIAKSARRSPGIILDVLADAFAFESDVKAWVENSKSKILKLEKDGVLIKVQIELAN